MRYKWRITAATSPEGSAGESARNVLIPVGTYAGSRGLAGRLAVRQGQADEAQGQQNDGGRAARVCGACEHETVFLRMQLSMEGGWRQVRAVKPSSRKLRRENALAFAPLMRHQLAL